MARRSTRANREQLNSDIEDNLNGETDEPTLTEDSDVTGQALYQEDATGEGMHIEGKRIDEIILEGDDGTGSPEEYEEIDKGNDLAEPGPA